MSLPNITHVYGELTRGPLNRAGGDPGQPGRSVVALPMQKGKERPRLKMLVGSLSNQDRVALAALAPNVEFIEARDREDALRQAPEVHAAVGQFVSPEFLRRAGNLRWVQPFSAGGELALMKEGSFFINIARGEVVNTAALLQAVRSKKLAGAGLDVTDPEPLPPEHPLWKEPRVLITPHVSGQSPGTRQRVRQLFFENVRRFASGEPLLNVVDKKAGY